MSKKADKFFREKLGEMQSTPGMEAWQALEDHLKKKKRKVLFWRIAAAASILLLFSIGFLTWNINVAEEDSIVAQDPAKTEIKAQEPLVEVEEPESLIAETEPVETVEVEAPIHEELIVAKEIKREQVIEPVKEPETDSEFNEVLEQLETEPLLVEADPVEEPEEKLPPITIEYRSGPKVASNEQPLDSGGNKGIIKKIAKVAKDVRESDLGMASLREAKDDFLAFRKKEKTEVENN